MHQQQTSLRKLKNRMHHCLSKQELKQLLDAKNGVQEIEDELLRIWVANAECWTDELAGLNYFLSQILERKQRSGEDCGPLIDLFFDLENQMALIPQAFDLRFVEFMLRRVRNRSMSLEEELITLQDDVGDYRYDRALRFRHNLTDLSFR